LANILMHLAAKSNRSGKSGRFLGKSGWFLRIL
jgi:hypothetical protein